MQKTDRGGPGSGWAGQHHRHFDPRFLILILSFGFSGISPLWSQSGLLEARIVEGDGQVSMPGNRLSRPLIIEVTDETGMRVENAFVSFRVPEDGVTATFHNGLRTEILRTDGDGHAEMRGLWMGGLAGQFQVRLTVAKGGARAGTISTQFIAPDTRRRTTIRASILRPHGRVLEVGALLLAVAAAGYAKQSLFAPSAPKVVPEPVIGSPTLTIGKP